LGIWLLKTEPRECSLDDIRAAAGGVMRWDGIRNYQARNLLRDAVRTGDLCLIYHSGIREPALVGSAEVVQAAYPDPAQFDAASPLHDPASTLASPRWFCIDIRYREHFPRPVTLGGIRATPELAAMVLLRQGRLSVQPVTAAEWRAIAPLAGLAPA
jgi:predicted RNA-binding protein with PUA-like domain